jgi:hypothetical protein
MRVTTYENWGRVIHHESGGLTVVEITNEAGVRLEMRPFEMLTECIPAELRRIGSRFLFQWDGIWPEESDTPDKLRERCRKAFRVLGPAAVGGVGLPAPWL